jgi:hypothetical protein
MGSGAVVLVGGPLAGVAGAGAVHIFVDGGNIVSGQANITDNGPTDTWWSQDVGETQTSPFNPICDWQGQRIFVHEQDSGRFSNANASNFHDSCSFVTAYSEHPSITLGEVWDLRFKWKSNHTSNDDYEIVGTING